MKRRHFLSSLVAGTAIAPFLMKATMKDVAEPIVKRPIEYDAELVKRLTEVLKRYTPKRTSKLGQRFSMPQNVNFTNLARQILYGRGSDIEIESEFGASGYVIRSFDGIAAKLNRNPMMADVDLSKLRARKWEIRDGELAYADCWYEA